MKVAFYKSTRPGLAGVFNRLVRWWTRGPYSHVELIINPLVQHRGLYTCYSSSAMDGGVRTKLIDLCPARWDIVELNPALYDAEAARIWYLLHMGAKFDFRGIFGGVIRSVADDREKYFCSESVAAALGFDEPWRFDPNTLYAVLRREATKHE